MSKRKDWQRGADVIENKRADEGPGGPDARFVIPTVEPRHAFTTLQIFRSGIIEALSMGKRGTKGVDGVTSSLFEGNALHAGRCRN